MNAGARSRQSLVLAGIVMAIVIVAFGELASHIAMPALAGLLILIGYRTIKPDDLVAAWRTGSVQKKVLSVTFVLTVLIPLQFAVLVGVGLSVVLHVVQQSAALTLARWELEDDGTILETDVPARLGKGEIAQPTGRDRSQRPHGYRQPLPRPATSRRRCPRCIRRRAGVDRRETAGRDGLTAGAGTIHRSLWPRSARLTATISTLGSGGSSTPGACW